MLINRAVTTICVNKNNGYYRVQQIAQKVGEVIVYTGTIAKVTTCGREQ
jgi:hypothetical protein